MPMPGKKPGGGVAGVILDKMDAENDTVERQPMTAVDDEGNSAAQESAASDFAAAVKGGKPGEIVSSLKELLDLIKE